MAWFVRSDASKSLDSGRKKLGALIPGGRARSDNCGCGEAYSGLSWPRRILSAAGAARPPADSPGAHPPACLPARPTEQRARARIPAAGSRVLLGPLHGPLGGAGFICCFQERTVPHTSARLARVAHCPKRALPRVGLRGPDGARGSPAPPRPASLGRARPAPTCLAPLVLPRPTVPGQDQPRPAPRALPLRAALARARGPGVGETWSGRTVPRGPDLRPRAGRADRSGPPACGPLPGCPADGASRGPAWSRPQISRGPRRPLRAAGARAAPRLPCGWSSGTGQSERLGRRLRAVHASWPTACRWCSDIGNAVSAGSGAEHPLVKAVPITCS